MWVAGVVGVVVGRSMQPPCEVNLGKSPARKDRFFSHDEGTRWVCLEQEPRHSEPRKELISCLGQIFTSRAFEKPSLNRQTG